jgi:hypothetical protein
LLNTFYVGPSRWPDRQLPDGTGSLGTPSIAGLSCGYCGASDRVLPGIRPRTVLRRIMNVKLDTMSLISAVIAVAIWVLVIFTAIAAIVAHI